MSKKLNEAVADIVAKASERAKNKIRAAQITSNANKQAKSIIKSK